MSDNHSNGRNDGHDSSAAEPARAVDDAAVSRSVADAMSTDSDQSEASKVHAANAMAAEQSWHNPKSRWRKKRRRVVIWHLVAAGFFFATLLFQIFILIKIHRSSPSSFLGSFASWSFLLIFGAMIIALIGFGIGMTVAARNRMRLTRRILEQNGAVCPWCERTIEQVDAEPNDAQLRCSHCDESCTLQQMQQYWTDHALNQLEAAQWSYKHRTHPPRKLFARMLYRLSEAYRPGGEKLPWRWKLTLEALTYIPFAFLFWLFFRNILLSVIAAGIVCVALEYFGRWSRKHYAAQQQEENARSRHCAGCDYQLPPGDATPQRCPECGSGWQSAGTVYTGQALDIRRMAPVFVFFSFIILIMVFVVMSPLGIGMQFRTTNSLIKTVTTTRSFVNQEWDELNRRTLSPEIRSRLAEGLLTRRDDRDTLNREANGWFFDQILLGTLPDHIIDRFGRGLVKVDFDVPDNVRRGEEITIGLHNISRYQLPMNNVLEPVLFFAGYTLNDDPTPIGRDENALDLNSFGTIRIYFGIHHMASRYESHELKFTPAETGEHVIRARYWLALLPLGTGAVGQPIIWNEDGSPALPPGTVWSEKIMLEHRLVVP